jgi:predicted SnoaL-like aldol condensation-catalyzing enzyme
MGAQDDNKALVRRFYAEIDAGNLEAMDELVAPGFVDHDPPPIPGLATGLPGLKQAFEIFWRATPGTHEVLDQVAEDDLVATRIRARGRFAEDLGDIRATKGELDVTATAVYRISGGQLTEHWGETDSLRLMQQLGVLPAPARTRAC